MIKFFSTAIVLLTATCLLRTPPSFAYPAPSENQPFHMGVYLYEFAFADLAQEQGVDYFDYLEQHLKILHDNGVNTVYLGGATPARFTQQLELFKKYGITVVPQLDFAYYRPNWNDETLLAQARKAADFINKYADAPNVLAFSVAEEIPHNTVSGLARYYAAILALAPKARFQLINSNLGAATDLPVPDPVIMGTDRYAFWWESSGGGYRASPGFSLNWVREQADRYYWQSARRGADFSLVVTQGGLMMPAGANRVAGNEPLTYPSTKEEQDKLRQRVRMFAAQNRMGWSEFDSPQGKRYNVWKYYRLPQNTLRALGWTGVLNGAKAFYIWSYTPPTKKRLETTFQSAALEEKPAGEVVWMTLAGRPGIENPQLAEFARTSREIRAYEGVISRMHRTDEAAVQCDQQGIFHNTFTLPGLKGRIVVLHNANVGTWAGNSANFFKDSDDVRIDDEGNLVGYQPFEKPLDIRFGLKNEAMVYDVQSGRQLAAANGQYTVALEPGAGTLLFIGSAEEAQTVQAWMKK